jgi:hypothetical protein
MPPLQPSSKGKRFVGDKKTKVFHDSYFEADAGGADSCGIADLPPECIQTFDPDTPLEAILKGFAPCAKCLWAKRSRHE